MCLGIPGKILTIYQSDNLSMGKIDFGGVLREVCLSYVPEAKVGDYVLVHVGFALNLLSEQEAQDTLAILHQIEEIDAELRSAEQYTNELPGSRSELQESA